MEGKLLILGIAQFRFPEKSMKKFNIFSKVAIAAFLVASAFVLAGCKPGVEYRDVNVELSGTWAANESERYTITYSSFESENTYKGDNLVIVQDSAKSGRIFIKYTQIPDWGKDQDDEPADKTGWTFSFGKWYPSDVALIGKWYAISYKDLTSKSIKLSGAFGAKKATDTLEEAIAEFTAENNYFAFYSDCVKTGFADK